MESITVRKDTLNFDNMIPDATDQLRLFGSQVAHEAKVIAEEYGLTIDQAIRCMDIGNQAITTDTLYHIHLLIGKSDILDVLANYLRDLADE